MKQLELQHALEELYGEGSVTLTEQLELDGSGETRVIAEARVTLGIGQRLRTLEDLGPYRKEAYAAFRAARLISVWAVKLDAAREKGDESAQAEAVANLVRFGGELRQIESKARA